MIDILVEPLIIINTNISNVRNLKIIFETFSNAICDVFYLNRV